MRGGGKWNLEIEEGFLKYWVDELGQDSRVDKGPNLLKVGWKQ